jgi:O-methyltransferase
MMGISFGLLERLRSDGLFRKGCRILDIGSSNLYNASVAPMQAFLAEFNPGLPPAKARALVERLAKGSAYDPQTGGTNKAFAGELLEACGFSYLAFDIADGYRTQIFDLNRERLSGSQRNAFYVVLNIGTTEHVLNQHNSFELIHNATKVGGHIVHQLPASGFTDHGYFVYTGRLFFDLAGYNGYEIIDCWYEPAGEDDLLTSARAYKSYFPRIADLAELPAINIPNVALTVVYRKTKRKPFKACLELSTSVRMTSADVHTVHTVDATETEAPRSPADLLLQRTATLSGRLARDPKQLDEIYDLYGQYVALGLEFPLALEEHSLRLILEFLRPDDKEAAARLATVLHLQGKTTADVVTKPAAPTQPTGQSDLNAVLAQIEQGHADRTAVMSAVEDCVRKGMTPPLLLEMKSLEYFLEADPTRTDLKRRLHAVLRMLHRPIPPELSAEIQAGFIDEEYAIDFQQMLREFSDRVRYSDMEPEFLPLLEQVRPYSMTTVERLYGLWTSVRYLIEAGIEGDFVEAGVWRGGSVMLMARELLRSGAKPRPLWLYDTFAGLPKPDETLDIDVLGNRGIDGWQAHNVTGDTSTWAFADEAEVRANMTSTGYPGEHLRFVVGKVEETVPAQVPDRIALLRIDTDWYASYKHLLNSMYDRLVPGGVLLLDDYGHFLGARRAVDEFRRERGIHQPLMRLDYSCRMMIKP